MGCFTKTVIISLHAENDKVFEIPKMFVLIVIMFSLLIFRHFVRQPRPGLQLIVVVQELKATHVASDLKIMCVHFSVLH